jgi:hypothetical protein
MIVSKGANNRLLSKKAIKGGFGAPPAPPAAPIVSGTIADQTVSTGIGVITVEASPAFTGANIIYTLTATATGVSVDGITGTVSIDRATSVAGSYTITVQASNAGGFVTASFSLTVTGATLAANSITQGGVTFAFTGSPRIVGNSFDGAAYIVIPDGGSVSMIDPTPAVSSVTLSSVTYATNGVSVNPGIGNVSGYIHPFDQRIAYNAANLATFPRTLYAGDIVVKAISNPTLPQADRRDGVINQYAVCHIINETQFAAMGHPMSEMLSPAPFSWASRTTKVWRYVNMDGLFALRPNLSLASVAGMPDISTIVTRFNRFNIGLNATISTTESGYEGHCLNNYGSPTGGNYGPSLSEAIRIVSLAFLGDTPRSTIEPAIRRFVAIGSWWFDQEEGKGSPRDGDGGHWQFHFNHMIFGLLATGRASRVNDIATVSPQNQLSQSFTITSAHLAQMVLHNNTTFPFTYRQRAVSAIGSTTITVATNQSGDPTWVGFYGLECRKVSDNTLIGIVSTGANTSGNSLVVQLDRTVVGLTTSELVYFPAPSSWYPLNSQGWVITGDVIGGSFRNWNPSTKSTYWAPNCWAADAMLIRGLGLYSTQFSAFEGLVKRMAYDQLPTAMIGKGGTIPMFSPFPVVTTDSTENGYQSGHGQYVKNFWDVHSGTLSLSSAPVVQTVTLSAPTFTDRFIAPHLGSTGRAYGIVPISGNGTVGAIIQARAYDQQFAGANTTDWQTVATVGAGGTWSAQWQCPMTPFWGFVEVRVTGLDGTIQRGNVRFAVGLIFLTDGQSELSTGFSDFYTALASRPTVAAPGDCFIATHGDKQDGEWVDELAYGFESGLPAHISNHMHSTYPNIKSAIGYPARAGTGPDQVVDDSLPGRLWADNMRIFNAITRNGAVKPSILCLLWTGNPTSFGNNYGKFFSEIMTQKRMNGTSFTLPNVAEATKSSGVTVNLDHTYAEQFGDWSDSKLVNGTLAPPHSYYSNYILLMQAWIKARADMPHFAAITDNNSFFMLAPHSRGRNEGGGVAGDQLHPSPQGFAGLDGGIRVHRSLLDACLRTQGLITQIQPVPNNWVVDPAGAYAELGVTGYTLRNLWDIRGETRPAAMRKAIGVSVNGSIPYDADYVGGKLRVYSAPGVPFNGLDYFSIDTNNKNMSARGVPDEDVLNQYWKAFPHIVPTGGTTLDAIPIDLTSTSITLMANNLIAPLPILRNQSASDGSYTASSITPAEGTKMVIAGRFNSISSIDASRFIELAGLNPCDIYVNGASNTLQVRVRNGSTVLFQATYPLNKAAVKNHIVTVDATTRTVKVYELDGNEVLGSVVPLTPTLVTTSWTASTYSFNAGQVRLFNSSAFNRSLAATSVGQIVVAVENVIASDTDVANGASIVDLGGVNEQVDIQTLSKKMRDGGTTAYNGRAQVVIGDQTTLANWNSTGAFNTGTGPNTGWTRSGTFT